MDNLREQWAAREILEGLTLIGDEEITRHELPDGDYDITGLLQAQLAHNVKQIKDKLARSHTIYRLLGQ